MDYNSISRKFSSFHNADLSEISISNLKFKWEEIKRNIFDSELDTLKELRLIEGIKDIDDFFFVIDNEGFIKNDINDLVGTGILFNRKTEKLLIFFMENRNE
jgi:hypothetical protein